jgi:hypothetical protein
MVICFTPRRIKTPPVLLSSFNLLLWKRGIEACAPLEEEFPSVAAIDGLSAKDQLLKKIKAARPNRGDAAKEEFRKLYLDNADFIFQSGELSGQDFREIQKKWVSAGFQWTDFIDMANGTKNSSETSDQDQGKSSAPEKTADAQQGEESRGQAAGVSDPVGDIDPATRQFIAKALEYKKEFGKDAWESLMRYFGMKAGNQYKALETFPVESREKFLKRLSLQLDKQNR